MTFDFLISKLHDGVNPYAGFPSDSWPPSFTYNPSDPHYHETFLSAVNLAKPTLIIEVGSFLGHSAIHFAHIAKGAIIICVDTWCSGFDHWVAKGSIPRQSGFPTFYQIFISNVIVNGCQNSIIPLPSDSQNAAKILNLIGVSAQLIYIDGSHQQGDVLNDLTAYWKILTPGGAMLIDDFTEHFPGVVHDVRQFATSFDLPLNLSNAPQTILQK